MLSESSDPALLCEEILALRAELARAREATRRADQRLSVALQAFDSVVWELSIAMAEHAHASRAAGADGHVTKPISARALVDAVSEALMLEPASAETAVA